MEEYLIARHNKPIRLKQPETKSLTNSSIKQRRKPFVIFENHDPSNPVSQSMRYSTSKKIRIIRKEPEPLKKFHLKKTERELNNFESVQKMRNKADFKIFGKKENEETFFDLKNLPQKIEKIETRTEPKEIFQKKINFDQSRIKSYSGFKPDQMPTFRDLKLNSAVESDSKKVKLGDLARRDDKVFGSSEFPKSPKVQFKEDEVSGSKGDGGSKFGYRIDEGGDKAKSLDENLDFAKKQMSDYIGLM